MNTREEIIALLSKSKGPLGAKRISSELKKTSANIRKILSNLCKEGKITRAGYGEYRLSVNVLNKSVNVLDESVNVEAPGIKHLINKEIYKYRKAYLQRLKVNNPEAYEKIRFMKYEYYKRWRTRNPNYNKEWLRKAYKKDPERFKEYQIRYWLKKALSQG